MTAPAETAAPSRTRVRARLAIGASLSALLVAAIVAIAAAGLSAWRSGDPAVETQAGAARVGDGVAVVVVAEDGKDAAAQARSDALRWTLIALGAAIVPAAVVGWFISGRLLGTVDHALADIERTDAERTRRLQELAHELRTPLAVMGVNLELAATDAPAGSDLAGRIHAARRAGDRMTTTVSNLAGNGALRTDAVAVPLDLATEVEALVAEHEGPAMSQGVRLHVPSAEPLIVPSVDPAAVHIALGNLLANAVRFAPKGSAVTVDRGEFSDWAWIAVVDEGPGIAARFHRRVFERGWRGRAERAGSSGDAPQRGLGLAIARQFVDANDAALTVESTEGVGSTFTLWLPITDTANRRDVVAHDGLHPVVSPWRRRPVSV